MVYTGKSHSNEWFGGTTILGNLHIIHVYIYISYTYHTAGCRQHVLLSDLLQCRSSTYQHRVSDPECWRVVSRWRGFIFSEIQQPTNTSKLHRRSAANTCLTYLCCHKAGLFPNHPWNGQKHSILCPGHHWCFQIIFRFFFFLTCCARLGWFTSVDRYLWEGFRLTHHPYWIVNHWAKYLVPKSQPETSSPCSNPIFWEPLWEQSWLFCTQNICIYI